MSFISNPTTWSNLNYIEVGLPVRFMRAVESGHIIGLKNSNFIYTRLEELLNDFVKFDSLSFKNYKRLFQLHLLICSCLLLLAIGSPAVQFSIKHFSIKKSSLKNYLKKSLKRSLSKCSIGLTRRIKRQSSWICWNKSLKSLNSSCLQFYSI